MLRTHGLTALIVTSLFSFSSSAFAGPTGTYIGLQVGYTNTNQDALTSADALSDFHEIASTVPSSFGNINTSNSTVASFSAKNSDDVFTGRLYAGYRFHSNLAFEGGLTAFRTVTLSYDAQINSGVGIVDESNNTSTQQYAVDLLFKGILPFESGFDLYAKLGVVLLLASTDEQIDLNNVPKPSGGSSNFTLTDNGARNSKGYPVIAIGGEYFFRERTGINIEYSKILITSSSKNNYELISIGIIQNINDIW